MKIRNLNKSISYLKSLIDQNGIIQFSLGNKKNYELGYAIEDQARALIVFAILQEIDYVRFFLELVISSWVSGKGFYTLRDIKGNFIGIPDGYEEASAEVLWALSEVKFCYPQVLKEYKNFDVLIGDVLQGVNKSRYIRVWSYSLLGVSKLGINDLVNLFAERLVSLFEKNSDLNWQWYEDRLTYANAIIPWSLFVSYNQEKRKRYLEVAEITLKFLLNNLSKDGFPIVVGNKGWWKKNKKMAIFDQQPIDVSYLVLCLLEAFKITGNKYYQDKSLFYYSWFHGSNLKGENMIRKDGACYDGLNESGVNKNSGAESNICYLLASLKIKEVLKIYK